MYVSNIFNSCVQSDYCIMQPYFECVCVELNTDKETNFLASVYSPSKGNLPDFLNALEQ